MYLPDEIIELIMSYANIRTLLKVDYPEILEEKLSRLRCDLYDDHHNAAGLNEEGRIYVYKFGKILDEFPLFKSVYLHKAITMDDFLYDLINHKKYDIKVKLIVTWNNYRTILITLDNTLIELFNDKDRYKIKYKGTLPDIISLKAASEYCLGLDSSHHLWLWRQNDDHPTLKLISEKEFTFINHNMHKSFLAVDIRGNVWTIDINGILKNTSLNGVKKIISTVIFDYRGITTEGKIFSCDSLDDEMYISNKFAIDVHDSYYINIQGEVYTYINNKFVTDLKT